MIWMMLGKTLTTTPSLRCLAIGPLGITLKLTPFNGLGNFLHRHPTKKTSYLFGTSIQTPPNLLIYSFFLSQVYKLPKDRFYATYFGGDEKLGLAPDAEARDTWLQFLPPGRVLPFGCKVCFATLIVSSDFTYRCMFLCVVGITHQ